MPLVKQKKQVVELHDPKTGKVIPFDKPYLILFVDIDSDDADSGEFQIIEGRENTYQFLLSNLMNYSIVNSYIMTGNIKFGEEVSVYSFMRLMIEKYFGEKDLSLDELNSMASQQMLPLDFNDSHLDALYIREVNKSVSK